MKDLDVQLFALLQKQNVTEDQLTDLINGGADINAVRKEDGATPLHSALNHNAPEKILFFLIRKGANVNAVCKDGTTILHAAAQYRSVSIFMELLLRNANINVVRERDGATPLHIAIEENKLTGFEKLSFFKQIMTYAGLNALRKDGKSALTIAIEKEHLGVIERLIELGANLQISSTEGSTIDLIELGLKSNVGLIKELFTHLKKIAPYVTSVEKIQALFFDHSKSWACWCACFGTGENIFSKIARTLKEQQNILTTPEAICGCIGTVWTAEKKKSISEENSMKLRELANFIDRYVFKKDLLEKSLFPSAFNSTPTHFSESLSSRVGFSQYN